MPDKIVVTDTMIWYGIENGKYPSQIEGVRIHATYVNLFELSLSPNLLKDLEWMSKVVRALHDAHPMIIETNPIEFIIKKQFPDYPVKDKKYIEMLKGFEKLMSIDFSKAKPEDFEEASNQFKKSIDDWRNILQDLADKVNEMLPLVRHNIKSSTGKKAHRKVFSLPLFAELLNFYVRSFTEGEVELDIETYPWEEVELFIRVWDNYFKELEVSSSQKFQANDWFDLFNMAYVSKDSLYWTEENKWVRLIESDENTKKFLFKCL